MSITLNPQNIEIENFSTAVKISLDLYNKKETDINVVKSAQSNVRKLARKLPKGVVIKTLKDILDVPLDMLKIAIKERNKQVRLKKNI